MVFQWLQCDPIKHIFRRVIVNMALCNCTLTQWTHTSWLQITAHLLDPPGWTCIPVPQWEHNTIHYSVMSIALSWSYRSYGSDVLLWIWQDKISLWPNSHTTWTQITAHSVDPPGWILWPVPQWEHNQSIILVFPYLRCDSIKHIYVIVTIRITIDTKAAIIFVSLAFTGTKVTAESPQCL